MSKEILFCKTRLWKTKRATNCNMTTLQSGVLPDIFRSQKLYRVPEPAWQTGTGAYGKRILALVSADGQMAAEDAELLTKILSAVNIDLTRDALVCTLPLESGLKIFPVNNDQFPEKVLIFGPTPAQLGLKISIRLYEPFTFYRAAWLFSETLHTLQPDKDRKARLWKALKQVFEDTTSAS